MAPFPDFLAWVGHHHSRACLSSLAPGGREPSYKALCKVSRPGHEREEKQQVSTLPCSCATRGNGRGDGGRTQPSPTCDPTKSPDYEQSGTIVVSKYWVGKWIRERGRRVHGLGREADLKT